MVQTRSRTRKDAEIVRAQTRCPISLQEFTPETKTFVHALVKFDAVQLRDYLAASPGSANPVNRADFTDRDIDALREACGSDREAKGLLKGGDARRAKDREAEEMSNVFFFEHECKSAFTRLSHWWAERDDFYHNAMVVFRNSLVEIKRDVLTYAGGVDYWKRIAAGLQHFIDEHSVPAAVYHDVRDTLDYLEGCDPAATAAPPADDYDAAMFDDDDDSALAPPLSYAGTPLPLFGGPPPSSDGSETSSFGAIPYSPSAPAYAPFPDRPTYPGSSFFSRLDLSSILGPVTRFT